MVSTTKAQVRLKTVGYGIKSILGASALLESPSSTLLHFRLASMTLWSYSITVVGLNRRGTRNQKNSVAAN